MIVASNEDRGKKMPDLMNQDGTLWEVKTTSPNSAMIVSGAAFRLMGGAADDAARAVKEFANAYNARYRWMSRLDRRLQQCRHEVPSPGGLQRRRHRRRARTTFSITKSRHHSHTLRIRGGGV